MKVRDKKQRRKALMIAACVFTIAGLSTTPLMNAALQAGIDASRNLASLFGERSPGARPAGALFATKMAKGPRQYAEPRTRQRPAVQGPCWRILASTFRGAPSS